jgi:hypothetical protein
MAAAKTFPIFAANPTRDGRRLGSAPLSARPNPSK